MKINLINKKLAYLLIILSILGCTPTKHTPLFDANFAEHNDLAKDLLLSQLPQPLAGFKWIIFQGVAIQVPTIWNEHKTEKAYASSVESIAKKGSFETGLTIQRSRNIKKTRNVSAAEYGIAYIKLFESDKNNRTLKLTFGVQGNNETAIYRYRNAPTKLKPIIVHKYIIASDKEDYVIIITFEAPEKDWGKIWQKYGEKILKNISIMPYDG